MASALDTLELSDRKDRFQHSLMMFRRSVSLNDYQQNYNLLKLKDPQVSYEKPKVERHISMLTTGQSPSAMRPSLQSQWSAAPVIGLPTEGQIGNLASVFFESYFDCYIRYIVLPVLLIFTFVYTFFLLPVQPKAEIYRSLSATFVLLIGVIVQCSFITIWATRRYGLNDLVTFLRYYIYAPQPGS